MYRVQRKERERNNVINSGFYFFLAAFLYCSRAAQPLHLNQFIVSMFYFQNMFSYVFNCIFMSCTFMCGWVFWIVSYIENSQTALQNQDWWILVVTTCLGQRMLISQLVSESLSRHEKFVFPLETNVIVNGWNRIKSKIIFNSLGQTVATLQW